MCFSSVRSSVKSEEIIERYASFFGVSVCKFQFSQVYFSQCSAMSLRFV